jgi:aminoglycoside 6'-N-acetyltransferase I
MAKLKSKSAEPGLRVYRPSDRPELVRLRLALWPDCSAVMHRHELRRLLARGKDCTVLVLDRGKGRLGGFVELSVRPRVDGSMSDRVGYVEGWFVDPDLRGRGWGRRMIRAAEAWTFAQGLTELGSDAELVNTGSIRAHRACGFRETFRLALFLKKVRRFRNKAVSPS